MSFLALEEAVEEALSRAIVAPLLDLLERRHAKNAFRGDCRCNFCREKRGLSKLVPISAKLDWCDFVGSPGANHHYFSHLHFSGMEYYYGLQREREKARRVLRELRLEQTKL